ncbi:unnamed protein product [Brassica rapa]|uniref:Uncharacterized protein n=2 Tax=Brassica TaxID=3705 RepID=A0A3P5YTZ8_BRACM|nr:unnamed protein product [Brassica napus]CAG7875658.1 unnamed protein product [Brassica rapa]VDC71252.1 unnamed protein product [Brassica rapa]
MRDGTKPESSFPPSGGYRTRDACSLDRVVFMALEKLTPMPPGIPQQVMQDLAEYLMIWFRHLNMQRV